MLLHKVSFSGDRGCVHTKRLSGLVTWQFYSGPQPEPTGRASLENSVCSKHPDCWLDVPPWNGKASTGLWQKSCARPWCPGWTIWACFLDWKPTALVVGTHFQTKLGRTQPEMMRVLRVKGTAALEVKFSDRCKTHGSEGVLQEHVCRSRTKVLGAKMIRHRCSQQQSTMPARFQEGILSNPLRANPHQREIQAVGFRGEYGRKAGT